MSAATSEIGTFRTWRLRLVMSVHRCQAEIICSLRVFRILTLNRRWALDPAVMQTVPVLYVSNVGIGLGTAYEAPGFHNARWRRGCMATVGARAAAQSVPGRLSSRCDGRICGFAIPRA